MTTNDIANRVAVFMLFACANRVHVDQWIGDDDRSRMASNHRSTHNKICAQDTPHRI